MLRPTYSTLLRKSASMAILGCCVCLLGACSSKTVSVRFKVNSEPEGSQVLYKLSGTELPCGERWIYLGNTPLRGIHQFKEEELENTDKITMKVMHNGYHDQQMEWDGESFWEEAEGKGVIFWTPELVPSDK
ncbi:hypothetical protein [Desulfogranum japonicum]|uniref:hypothetical protein n=1 Tax=Desulfogranum japonicum TaxID=231447 RepID=UPI00048E0C39|nr:hypothetical protein [Desulfogranum japonicum]